MVGTSNQLDGWIFSVDDHLLETDATFAGRLPSRLQDAAPRVVDHNGGDAWLIDGRPVPITIADGTASWPVEERPLLQSRVGQTLGAVTEGGDRRDDRPTASSTEERIGRNVVRVREDFRPGVYDVDARIVDMERGGIWASVLIPSISFGFAGQRFSLYGDSDVGLACVRAYNTWLYEDVAGAYPGRLVGSQVPWLRDPDVAATEIRRNADRGFTAMLFPENPERFGFPSVHSRHWDPIFVACEETDTVLNIHLGTGLQSIPVSSDSPLPVAKASIAVNPILSAFDWIFSGIPVRFPNIKIALTEGGIDWVPLVYGRLDTFGVDILEGYWQGDSTPNEVLLRNFWFAALFDVSFDFLARKCPDHVLVETDFPHGDTPWPDSEAHFADRLASLPADFKRKLLAENAAALYRQPLPPVRRTLSIA